MKNEKKGDSKTGSRDNLVKTLKGDSTEIVPADGLAASGPTFPSLTLDMDIVDGKNLKSGDKIQLGLETQVETVVDDEKNPTVTFKILGVSTQKG